MRRRYLENWRTYATEICREARKHLDDARVVVFGGAVRGDWTPDSDIDILVVTNANNKSRPLGRGLSHLFFMAEW